MQSIRKTFFQFLREIVAIHILRLAGIPIALRMFTPVLLNFISGVLVNETTRSLTTSADHSALMRRSNIGRDAEAFEVWSPRQNSRNHRRGWRPRAVVRRRGRT